MKKKKICLGSIISQNNWFDTMATCNGKLLDRTNRAEERDNVKRNKIEKERRKELE